MSRLRFVISMSRYYVEFADGCRGWMSQIAVEKMAQDKDWETVKDHPDQWYYL